MEHLNEGFDICYKCGKSQEYGTMTDITHIGFDIYCDKCHDKIMGAVKEGNWPRTTTFYKNLDTYLATAVAEGFCEGENATEDEKICAWQWLIDTGRAWELQGFFGRTASDLISAGVCDKPFKDKKEGGDK